MVAVLLTAIPAQAQDPTLPSEVLTGLNEILVQTMHFGLQPMILEKDVPVVMRDGDTLHVNVFRPRRSGQYPVIISFDIFGKDAYRVLPPTDAGIGPYNASAFTTFEAPDPGFWVPNGYVVIKAETRGTVKVPKDINERWTLQEGLDFFDIIEWAGIQPWSNGNVGTNGVSYLAMMQWRVGTLNPPHLKAMIPWEGLTSLYRDHAFQGGIPDTYFSARNIPPGSQTQHPLFDDFWKDREPKLSDVKVPILVGASWTSHAVHGRGAFEGFKQASSENKWMYVHGRKEWESYYSRESLEMQKRFFDYFLKGINNDWLNTPRVLLEVRERFYNGVFRYENEWPIARTQYIPLYLDAASGELRREEVDKISQVSYDSMAASGAQDSRVQFSVTFDNDTELTGYMKLKLWVSTDGSDDMDLFVGIKKFDRYGKELPFETHRGAEGAPATYGWLRVSHRELDPERSTPWQPWLKHQRLMKLEPDDIVPVEIEIYPSSTLFRAGESLYLVVQGSDIPHISTDALPAAPLATRHDETVNGGNHIIYTGKKYDSHLLVPVIPK
jgi:predicted acyl esterase